MIDEKSSLDPQKNKVLQINSGFSEISHILNISDISYVPKFFSRSESLMFVNIIILGNPIKALVDSGASRSFIELQGLELVKNLGLRIQKSHGIVQIANGSIQKVSDELVTPIELEDKVRLIKNFVLNSLLVDFVIGLDFLKIFNISVEYENRK